ncbi:hypothetical protein COO60DRAFT_1522370 [Scenedesmus sp. NREL 46B-D3]|nr:hypothetical protein COO60DRAFT_1522370 [Scenedesmus sp. NREL 46B-D3]
MLLWCRMKRFCMAAVAPLVLRSCAAAVACDCCSARQKSAHGVSPGMAACVMCSAAVHICAAGSTAWLLGCWVARKHLHIWLYRTKKNVHYQGGTCTYHVVLRRSCIIGSRTLEGIKETAGLTLWLHGIAVAALPLAVEIAFTIFCLMICSCKSPSGSQSCFDHFHAEASMRPQQH